MIGKVAEIKSFSSLAKAKVFAGKFKREYGYRPEIFKDGNKFVIVKPYGLKKV